MKVQQTTRSPPVFICPLLENGATIAEVTGDEARHGMRVRRLRVGNAVSVTNGRGLMAEGRVTSLDGKGDVFAVELDSNVLGEPARPRRILASALPKGERQSTMLDMATQLGMDEFIPLDCEHSAVRYQQKMASRWQRVVESACKQSRRSWFPVIEKPQTPASLLTNQEKHAVVIYGDHRGGRDSATSELLQVDIHSLVVMVGPEGGFSRRELALLEATDFAQGVAIGDHVLRTETAAVALLAHSAARYQ